MSRLIDADALKNDHHMGDECDKCETKWRECQYDYIYSKMDFCTWIDDAPTIELTDKIQEIEVVQCKDCEYYMNDAKNCWNDMINADMIIEPDWFCANAVRKDYEID